MINCSIWPTKLSKICKKKVKNYYNCRSKYQNRNLNSWNREFELVLFFEKKKTVCNFKNHISNSIFLFMAIKSKSSSDVPSHLCRFCRPNLTIFLLKNVPKSEKKRRSKKHFNFANIYKKLLKNGYNNFMECIQGVNMKSLYLIVSRYRASGQARPDRFRL